MDQAASLLCREGAALLLDCRTLETEHVALGLEDHELVTLVVDTRVRHDLADGGYADRRAACVAAAEALGVDCPARRDAGDAGPAGRDAAASAPATSSPNRRGSTASSTCCAAVAPRRSGPS